MMREAHRLALRNGEPLQVLFSLTACGVLASDREDWPLAARLLGAGEEMRRRIDFAWPQKMSGTVGAAWERVRGAIPESQCEAYQSEGAAMLPEHASQLAVGESA
jgi:hypothetical protein